MNANGSFKAQKAPCGRLVDGCVARRVVRDDGRVLVDEILSAE